MTGAFAGAVAQHLEVEEQLVRQRHGTDPDQLAPLGGISGTRVELDLSTELNLERGGGKG